MTDRRGFLYAAIAFLALAVGTVALLSGQTVQLSPGPVKLTSPPSISADSQWAVWLDAQGIGSAPLHGGAVVRLLTLAAGRQVYGPVTITPDSQRVVWVADTDTLGKPELYSAPISGGSPVRISKTMAADRHVRDYVVGQSQVYYASDVGSNNVVELYRVAASGGTSVKVNRSLPSADYDVFEYLTGGNPERVVYRVGRTVQGGHQLWSAPAQGSSAQAVLISTDLVTGGGVDGHFEISGNRAVYTADATDNGRRDLWSVPIIGDASTRLDRQDGRSVRTDWEIDGASASVIYSYTNSEWYRVPVLGGVSVAVAPPVEQPVTSPDGQYTLREVGASLWSERADGQMRRVSCLGQMVTMRWLGKPVYSVSADSLTVAYVGDGALWSGPISGAVCEIFRDGFNDGTTGVWR